MDRKNASLRCPIKKLDHYKKSSDISIATIRILLVKFLGLGNADVAIHARRSLQKTFLSGVADLYKDGILGHIPERSDKALPEEDSLSYFWKDMLTRAGQDRVIQEIDKLIGEFHYTILEYKKRAESGDFGTLAKHNTRALSILDAFPLGKDELGLIINTILIVIIAFRLWSKGESIENERGVILRISNSLIGYFLSLQKQEFNNAIIAFIESAYFDEDTSKDIFPITFNRINENQITWTFSPTFEEKLAKLTNNNHNYELGYTNMVTSCPAATHGLLPHLIKKFFNVLYLERSKD